MAQPLNVLTPPPSATSFISSTPTASLRSSATARRLSVVSLDPDFDLSKEGDHPERSRDSRIEKWLQQQCGGFLAWEHKRAELNSHEMGIPLRRVQSSGTLLTTCNTATTPVTNASFSWESDMLLSTSPTTPSSSPAVPSAPVPNFSGSTHLSPKPQFQPAHPETEAARADSPLLGFPGLAVAELTAPSTLGKPLDGAKPADVDKPLPLPPTTLDTNVLTSANAASTFYLNEVPPIPGTTPVRRRSSQIHPKLTPNHSPTPSYSSSDSSRQHHSPSHSNGHAQLPIGVANPQGFVHSRTPSGSSSNGHGGRVSRTSSFASSVQAAISLSMATLAPTRREILPELRQGSGTRSFLPLSLSTRKRSHSNAIPSAMKQFHLPTGMVHRSQSHAQLRNGPVPLSTFSSHDLQESKGVSHPHLPSSLLSVSGGTGVALRLAKKLSKSVISPSVSRTHSSTPSYASVSVVSRDDAMDPLRSRPSQFSPSHTRQTSDILERLESRVPSLSSSFSRNAVYIDSEDISARLDELLLLAKEEVENRVEEEDEDTVEAGEEGITGGDQWVDMVKGHSRGEGSINQPIASPPNTPATGDFGSAPSVAGSQAAGASNGFYASPEAGSSQVYLGSNPISQNHSIEQLTGKQLCIGQNLEVLRPSPAPPSESIDPDTTIREILPIVDFVPQEEIVEAFPAAEMNVTFLPKSVPTPEPIEDEETMEDALALARELAVEDRMVWGVRASMEMFDDCWSEFEDEEMGVGVCTVSGVPRMSVGPGPYVAYCSAGKNPDDGEGHVRFRLGDGHSHDIRNGGLAPPSVSKWSLTSSIDDEKRASLDDRPKKDKKRRSFVPFIVSGDKDKEHKDDGHKEHGTIGKKRNRLASFISRLSGVGLGGLGGSGSNSPSLNTPPFQMLSPSSSSNALSGLLSAPTIPSRDTPLLPTLTPNFSATPSRSPSPKALDDPQIQGQPQVTITDDDCSISSPSSSRLVLASPPTSRPLTPPPQIIPPVTSRRPLPPGIVIPPLPSRPPPELPTVAPPLGKAASESLINAKSPPPLMSRPRSNSTADSFGRHVTFTNSLHTPSSSSPRMEQMTLPSTLRRSVLAKSASASVLGLHQQLKPLGPTVPAAAEAGYDDDDGLIPPTPTSIISTEEYGEARRREDFYDDGHGLQSKRLRLRAMSSLGSLPLNGIVNPGPPRTKGGIKGFVGRLTGRGKNPAKVNQVHLSPSFFGTDHSNNRTADDSELSTPVAMYSPKLSSPKHSPSPSFSNGGNAPAASGVGVLSGFKLYLERTPFRQS